MDTKETILKVLETLKDTEKNKTARVEALEDAFQLWQDKSRTNRQQGHNMRSVPKENTIDEVIQGDSLPTETQTNEEFARAEATTALEPTHELENGEPVSMNAILAVVPELSALCKILDYDNVYSITHHDGHYQLPLKLPQSDECIRTALAEANTDHITDHDSLTVYSVKGNSTSEDNGVPLKMKIISQDDSPSNE
ncbi:hypothetical protein IWQ61_003841 [Dispira simplex]|nr:hypothetical protein IWQ61_003841 [Dispira simplex]